MKKAALATFVACVLLCHVNATFAAVGRTAASFDVGPTGNAQYSIPIFTPPGTAGMTPRLALAYSHDMGNSLAGMGVHISGLSVITRCSLTVAQDGTFAPTTLTRADKFCLDGNRLRLVTGSYGAAGSTYRTELDTFARITAHGAAGSGPLYFTVEQKNGLVYEYGNTVDSRIEPLAIGGGQVTTVGSWALNEIRDRAGNAIEVTYHEDSTYGAFRPNEIRWTSNSARSLAAAYRVVFVYEVTPRPDTLYGYRFGNSNVVSGQVVETRRIDRIDVLHNSAVVRRYELTYESSGGAGARSRLQSVQECGVGGSDCYSPTTFRWTNGTVGWSPETNTGQVVPAQPLVMDINGDGRDDVVYSNAASGSGTWHYLLANSNGGYNAAVSTGIANVNFGLALPIDWDGDGRWDFVVPYHDGTWWYVRSNGSGFDGPVNTGVAYSGAYQYWVADIDGDGRGDLLRAQTSSGSLAQIYARLRSGNGFAAETLAMSISLQSTTTSFMNNTFGGVSTRARSGSRQPDFNGDGREDYVVHLVTSDSETRYVEYDICVVYGAGASVGTIQCYASSAPYQGWLAAEANDDGLTDLVWFASNQATVTLSRGQSMGGSAGGAGNLSAYAIGTAVAADWDADGRDDLALVNASSGAWHVSRATGTGLSTFVTGPAANTGAFVATGDVNGDGLDDLMGTRSTDNAWRYASHAGVMPDFLDWAVDGFGNLVDFDYVSIAQGHYTKGSTAAFPDEQDYQGPVYVVSRYTASNGVGGGYIKSYWYYEARRSLKGRGLEGFNARRSLDNRTGLYVYEYTHRSFPYTGSPYQTDVYQSNGTTLISRTQNTWNSQGYGSGVETRSLPYVSGSKTWTYEVGGTYNGSLISTTTTSNTLHAATGELSASTTTTTEASTANGINAGQSYTRTVQHLSLLNDTTYWCIGRPISSHQTNSHSLYGGSAITRTTDVTWDSINCRPTQLVAQQGDASSQVTTGLAYDGFGNINSESVTGIGMPTRTTATNWGPTGQFPMSVTNALSQTITSKWDASLGVQTGQTDANNIAVSWQYDNFGRLEREDRPAGSGTTTATTWSYHDCASVGCLNVKNKMVVVATELNTSGGKVRDHSIYLDRFDRPIVTRSQTLSGAYNRVEREYDALGRVSREAAPCWWDSCESATSFWTRYTYDVLSRLIQTSRPVNDSSGVYACAPSDASPPCQHSYAYYEGLTLRTVDAEGKQSTKVAGVLGALSRSLDHAGYGQTFDYDAYGNVVRVSDNASGTTTLQSATYNVDGTQLSLTDVDSGTWIFTSNALGELVSRTNPLGKKVTYTRDPLGRVSSWVMPECTSGTITGTYVWGASAAARNIGRLQHHEISGCGQATFRETFTYDSAGRLSRTDSQEGATLHYYVDRTYNASTGLLETLTYPTSTQSYRLKVQYDYQYGLLMRAKDFSAPGTIFWQANATDARGGVLDESLGASVRTIRGVDQVTGLADYIQSGPAGSSTLQNLSYSWDRVGNLTERRDANQGLTEHFYYDNLHRLDYSTRNGATNLDLAYDLRGNITSKTGVGTYTYSGSRVHAVTRITSGSSSVSYAYNVNGEMTNRGGTQLSYYANGLLKHVTKDAANSSLFSYTADGRRWSNAYVSGGTQYTHRYIGDGGGVLYEKVTPGGGLTEHKHYIRAGGETVGLYVRKVQAGSPAVYTNTQYYLLKDHLGSTDAVIDASGAVVVRESFDAFGKRRGSNWTGSPTATQLAAMRDTTRRGFTFHEHLDSVDLVHMNGRAYDPHIARFVSPDPLIPDPILTQAFNRYSYAYNGPLSATDPSGFDVKNHRNYHDAISSIHEAGIGPRLSNIFVSCYGTCGDGYWNTGAPSSIWTSGSSGGHWVDYASTVGTATQQPNGDVDVPVSAPRSEWVSGARGTMLSARDALWGLGAGLGNGLMNSAPVMMMFSESGNYRWFKGPGTRAGEVGERLNDVVSIISPYTKASKLRGIVGATKEAAQGTGGLLVRFGKGPDTVESLAAQAAKAEANGLPHGVSTRLRDRLSTSDVANHRCVPKCDVEKVFPVEQTGADPRHHTVVLPKPVTREVTDQFNELFGR